MNRKLTSQDVNRTLMELEAASLKAARAKGRIGRSLKELEGVIARTKRAQTAKRGEYANIRYRKSRRAGGGRDSMRGMTAPSLQKPKPKKGRFPSVKRWNVPGIWGN